MARRSLDSAQHRGGGGPRSGSGCGKALCHFPVVQIWSARRSWMRFAFYGSLMMSGIGARSNCWSESLRWPPGYAAEIAHRNRPLVHVAVAVDDPVDVERSRSRKPRNSSLAERGDELDDPRRRDSEVAVANPRGLDAHVGDAFPF